MFKLLYYFICGFPSLSYEDLVPCKVCSRKPMIFNISNMYKFRVSCPFSHCIRIGISTKEYYNKSKAIWYWNNIINK